MKYQENLLGTLPDTRLAKLTGKSIGFIYRNRIKQNIPTYTSQFGSLPRNNYDIFAFDNMDNISAYWLGFYFADGCVCETTNNRKIVTLSSVDLEVLQKLVKFYKIKENLIGSYLRDGKKYYRLDLCNKHLFEKLSELGCVSRKSMILDKPNIDEKFYLPFLLGFFDGDGSISVNRTINSWKVSIGTGGYKFFKWLSSMLNNFYYYFSTEYKLTENKKNFYVITMCGVTAKAFLNKLYNSIFNKNIPLKRKFCLYKKLCKVKFARGPDYFDWEINYINKEHNNYKCLDLIKNDFRNYGWIRSIGSIRKKRKSLKF